MYPQKQNEYYPSAPPPPPPPPPPAMGVPMSGPTQYYPPPGPAVLQSKSHVPGQWSTGLCDCGEDCGNCCMTWCCPCVTFGRIAEIVDKGSTSCGTSGALYALLQWFTCFHWIYSCTYRSKMRAQYKLRESPCIDCFVHCCCEPCALCQEYRELQNQGYDMTIGWHANMERQGITQPPVTQGGMIR